MNQQLWNEFMSGKTVVNCRTENQAKKFQRICQDKGFKDFNETFWDMSYREEMCYHSCGSDVLHGDIKFYKGNGYKVITYKQLMQPDKPAEFDSDGKQYKGWEILKMIEEGKLKDDDFDTFNKEGLQIAGLSVKEGIPYYTGTWRSLVTLDFIMDSTFKLRKKKEQKQYLTFDEARKTEKTFKYKNWKWYIDLSGVMENLKGKSTATINSMLDERAWEVEP